MDYYFKLFTPDLADDWNNVAENSDEVWLFHELEVFTFFGNSTNAENISIIMYDKDSLPVAICPLFKTKVKHKFNIQTVKIESLNMSGPALINKFGDKKRREILLAFALEFKKLIKLHTCNFFLTASANLAKRNIDAYVNPLLDIQGFSDRPRAYYYLDLRQSETELLSKMETRTRTILKKLDATNEFEIVCGTTAHIDDILFIAQQTKERFGETFDLNNKTLFNFLLQSKYFKTFIAYINNKPACCIVLSVYKNTGYYYYSYTTSEFIPSEIGTYLFWHAIKQAKNQGVEHFDIGTNLFSPDNVKDVLISKFKRGFGGTLKYKFWIQYTNTPKLMAIFRILKMGAPHVF